MIYQNKVDKLVIDNAKSIYQSCVYIAPADKQQTTGLGQLFIIVEAKSREKKIPSILGQVADELSEYYYHSPTKNSEAAMETTAQYFNENILDITAKNLKWIKERMSILMAVVDNDRLILTNYNNIKTWLFRNNKIHEITGGQTETKKSAYSKKILGQLISGQLINDDVLLLTNSTIFDYFSDEKIKKTVGTLAPTQACAFFKNTLIDYKVPVDFSTIIVKFNIFKKEIKEIVDMSKQNVLEIDNGIQELNRSQPGLINKIILKSKTGLARLVKCLQQNIIKIIRGKIKTSKMPSKKESVPRLAKEKDNLPTERQEKKQKIIAFKKWKSFNRLEFGLLILIIIIAALFGGSLLMVNTKKEKKKKEKNFQKVTAEINDKINSVEAALIYKDEDRAQELLSEARSLLNSLKKENATEQYAYQQLSGLIENQVNRIYKLDRIKNPEVMVALASDFNPTSNIFISTNNIIYLARGGEIYKVNSLNQALDKVAEAQAQISKIMDFGQNRLLLKTNQKELWLLDTNNYSLRKIGLSLPSKASRLIDIATYAQKIYILDTGSSNIYKYNYKTVNFDKPAVWLKDKMDIDGNQYIAVDGNIWLAAKDGKITKFFKGKKEIFSLKGEYEPISQNTLLQTNERLKYLYLLDKDKNRILLADKQGKVIKQLLGDGLENILSISVNGNESELYVLTQKNIYKIIL